METRASYMLVGGFVLTFLAGLVAFAIWIAKVDLDAEYTDYDIYFDDTVSGLLKRSIVYYAGIPVGDVRDITLAPQDASKVRVWIRVRAEVPVNEESVAKLEFQGLTGVAYIELSGGSPDAPKLVAKEGEERPVIQSEASPLLAIFESAPNLVNEAIIAVGQIQKLLSDENISSVSGMLKNSERLTGNLADGSEDIEVIVADVKEILTQTRTAATQINQLVETGNTLLEEDAKRLVDEAVTTMKTATTLLARVDNMVAANEGAVTQFVNTSLPEVSRMILDLRVTARNLSRLVSRIEQNPSSAIFGKKEAEYDLQKRTTVEEGN